MYVLAQVTSPAGDALMMVVRPVAMGGVSAGRRWRLRPAPRDERQGRPVDGVRREIESLKEAFASPNRSGAQS